MKGEIRLYGLILNCDRKYEIELWNFADVAGNSCTEKKVSSSFTFDISWMINTHSYKTFYWQLNFFFSIRSSETSTRNPTAVVMTNVREEVRKFPGKSQHFLPDGWQWGKFARSRDLRF